MTATEAGKVTGYNIFWFTETYPGNVLRLETYIEDAELAGDKELGGFFRRAQTGSRKGPEQGGSRLG